MFYTNPKTQNLTSSNKYASDNADIGINSVITYTKKSIKFDYGDNIERLFQKPRNRYFKNVNNTLKYSFYHRYIAIEEHFRKNGDLTITDIDNIYLSIHNKYIHQGKYISNKNMYNMDLENLKNIMTYFYAYQAEVNDIIYNNQVNNGVELVNPYNENYVKNIIDIFYAINDNIIYVINNYVIYDPIDKNINIEKVNNELNNINVIDQNKANINYLTHIINIIKYISIMDMKKLYNQLKNTNIGQQNQTNINKLDNITKSNIYLYTLYNQPKHLQDLNQYICKINQKIIKQQELTLLYAKMLQVVIGQILEQGLNNQIEQGLNNQIEQGLNDQIEQGLNNEKQKFSPSEQLQIITDVIDQNDIDDLEDIYL